MRLDLYLSTLGIVKRRTEAKRLADSGAIHVNNQSAKPGHQVREGDIIKGTGSKPWAVEVIQIPKGSVSKDRRDGYYREIGRQQTK